jgi:hypothetical protein
MNRLYFGDNLKWLSHRKEFPDASVDLALVESDAASSPDPGRLCLPRQPQTGVHYRNQLPRTMKMWKSLQ